VSANFIKLFQGHEMLIVAFLNAIAALIIALVKLVKVLVGAARKLFTLWQRYVEAKAKLLPSTYTQSLSGRRTSGRTAAFTTELRPKRRSRVARVGSLGRNERSRSRKRGSTAKWPVRQTVPKTKRNPPTSVTRPLGNHAVREGRS
jgi:hypothetical protein